MVWACALVCRHLYHIKMLHVFEKVRMQWAAAIDANSMKSASIGA